MNNIMFSKVLRSSSCKAVACNFHTATPLLKQFNVAVLGAAGGIGQPLSLLMKTNPKVKKLACYDIANVLGVAADLSHISTDADVVGYEKVEDALSGTDIVLIPAGVPRKPGMTRDDLFDKNASVVKNLISTGAKVCPNAMFCIITNPVNSTVPIAAEVLKKAGVYNPKRLFGVTTLDLVRTERFVQGLKGVATKIPVVGGHSGPTILPLLSQIPGVQWTDEELASLTHRIQYAGDEVVKAKGNGSATLSMAFAAWRFADSLLRALDGEKNVEEYAFVDSHVDKTPFFSSRIELDAGGICKIHPVPTLSVFEKAKYDEGITQLDKDIKKGQEWARAQLS